MGNRANYILIENGETGIYFSRGGALTISTVLVSGPEATKAYIQRLPQTAELLNNLWSEGNILMDIDARQVLFWGGDLVATRPYLRRPLLAALALVWQDWSIQWAVFGVADLTKYMGLGVSQGQDNETVDKTFLEGSQPMISEAQLLESLSVKDPGTIITTRSKTGEVKDYLFSCEEYFAEADEDRYLAAIYQALSLGPRLLDILPAATASVLPAEGSEEEPGKGAYIDEERQTIWLWESETLDQRYLETVALYWPGWQVKGHVDGLARQISLSGRDPSIVSASNQQVVEKLIIELTQSRGFNPAKLVEATRHSLPPEDLQHITFSRDFFNADTPFEPQTLRELLEQLLPLLLAYVNKNM